MKKILNKIIEICIYLLVFLLPLFFLPLSFEAFEFNKQYLLALLVSIAFFSWLAKMVLVDKEIRFKRTPLDVFVAAFIFVAVISAIFSVDKGSSLFGFYGKFSDGLIGLVSLGIFYFLITNNTQINTDRNADKHRLSVNGLIRTFLWSVFFVILFSYFSIFGLWQRIPGPPAIMKQPTFNPVSGSLEGLVVFLSIVVVLLIGLMLQKTQIKKNWLPVILLIAALGLLFSIFSAPLPKEEVPSQGLSWKVAFQTVTADAKSGFLGSGIGTYFYDFAKFKPVEFNQNPLWQVRFDRPGNHISEILATLGLLGLLSYMALVGMFLLISWLMITAPKSKFSIFNFQFSILVAFSALVVAQFFYYQNTVLAFLFWLFLALSVISWPPTTFQEIRLSKPIAKKVVGGFLIIMGFLILTSYYFGQKFYRADIAYAKTNYERAVRLNPNLSQYRIILARSYLGAALSEMRKPLTEQNSLLLQTKISEAINQVRIATALSPNWVAAWETLGLVYWEIHPIVQGAGEWGVKAFEKAISLEPTNPVLQTDLGKLYLALVEEDKSSSSPFAAARVDEVEKAKRAFVRAKELKSDYLDALIQEALIYEKENNLDEAIRKMEEVAKNYPLSLEAAFQLGRLYFNKDRLDEAISQFEAVLSLLPNHSNALYSLGVIWTKKGRKEKAISAFEKVLELNPGNQDAIQKLKELKKD